VRARGLALSLAGFALLGACAPESREASVVAAQAAPREPLTLEFVSPLRARVTRTVRATGTLFGEEQATVSAKVPGRVAAFFHDVGDALAPDTPLVQLEKVDYELALNERRRAFEQSLARLGIDALPESDVDVEKLPAVERARLQAENGFARYERGRLLRVRTPPAMSEQDYLDLQTAWSVAKADHRIAQLNARAQLAEARAQKAQLDTAAQRLVDTLHVVPGAGRSGAQYSITARRVSVGDYVTVGAPLFDLLDTDPLELRVRVPERHVAHVETGRPVWIAVESFAERFEGSVVRINPAIDVRTRTFEVEIRVPNAAGKLRAGAFATAEVETAQVDEVLEVERESVAVFAGVHKVFTLNDGKAQERIVELGPVRAGRVEVTRGIEAGVRLVRRPPAGLATGVPIREAEAAK
jgi:RND family efflux transporter MFP subunit